MDTSRHPTDDTGPDPEKDFAEADLQGVDFTRQSLRGARFPRAKLSGANFARKDLTGVKFWDANLQDADFSEARGLTLEQLGGADLRRAKLPASIDFASALDHVAQLSQNAGKVFLSLLATVGLLLLVAFRTSDVELLTNTGLATLPVINEPIPITLFFLIGPLVLFATYIGLHLYLLRLWEAMALLPAYFPDGTPVDQKTYPWLVNDLVRSYLFQLHGGTRSLFLAQKALFVFLCYWLTPLTAFFLWARYLATHSWPITILNIVVVALSTMYATIFLYICWDTLAKKWALLDIRTNYKKRSWWQIGRRHIVGVSVAVILGFTSQNAINGLNPKILKETYTDSRVIYVAQTGPFWYVWVPKYLNFIGCDPFANFEQSDVSTKPSGWIDKSGAEQASASAKKTKNARTLPSDIEPGYLIQIIGAKLQKANLRQALAPDALLVNADLRGTSMVRADLEGANLQWANLARDQILNLLPANLSGANLLSAKLDHIDMDGVDLTSCDLDDTHLEGAHLEGAHLKGAHLRGADLFFAKLDRADLTGADLSGADLTDASLNDTDLAGADLGLIQAKGALLENVDLEGADLDGDLEGADLSDALLKGAYLEDADMRDANLQNADMRDANLKGAHLKGARLIGAALMGAHLKGADLTGADLKGADLRGADLTGAVLKGATYDKHTIPPNSKFDPKGRGMKLVSKKPTPAEATGKATPQRKILGPG